jgi:hypothetical protein
MDEVTLEDDAFKYQGLKNNSSKIFLTLHPPITVLHGLTLDDDGGKALASLADRHIISLIKRISLRNNVSPAGLRSRPEITIALAARQPPPPFMG